jgi:hypothetical protein
LVNPHPHIWGPFNIVLLELVAGFFGRLHELFQLKIDLIHAQLNLNLRDMGAILINQEEFLKDMVPFGELVEYPKIVSLDRIRCAVEQMTHSGKNMREHITKD